VIRAVYFDMGGVLLRSEFKDGRRKWERRLGLAEGELAHIVFENRVAGLATVGQADTDAVWAEVGRLLALAPGPRLAELKADFFAGDAIDVDLLAFIRALRPWFKTGLISNAWPSARAETRICLNATVFDLVLFSAEEGVKKPDPEIYHRALARLGVAPAEAVFVDDVSANLDAAQALGMAGIQFLNAAQVRGEIEALIHG
jgi:epoxide hydrolase-like predicted phosphatase